MGLRSPLVGLAIWTACLCMVTSVSGALAGDLVFSWSGEDVRLSATPEGYATVEMARASSSADPGTPDLPWIPVTVQLQRQQTIRSWSFDPAGWIALDVDVAVVPAIDQGELSVTGTARFAEDPAIYGSDLDYPAEGVRFLGVQSGAGKITAGFLVSPFRWNPGTRVLEMATGGTLHYDVGPDDSDRFLPDRLRPVAAEAGVLSRGAASGIPIHSLTQLGESRVPSLEGTPVEFLLITTEEFKPAFEELIEWKIRSGVPAALRTIEEIYEQYPQGVDRPEQIRLFLRDAYLYWGTRTVLIAGDPTQVPARYARDYSWNGNNGGTPIVTDLYYACLDGNWNANGNSLYGEPPVTIYLGQNIPPLVIASDFVDLRPELHVGRVSCISLAEAELYMKKYREYAIHPPQNPYLRDVLVLGEVLFNKDWNVGDCDECGESCPTDEPCVSDDGAEDGISLIEQISAEPGGSALQFAEYYERAYWWVGRGRPNAQALSLEPVISEINAGVNVIFHSGHGDRDRWAIGPDRMDAGAFRALNNGTTGPGWAGLVYSINCNSAAIDYDCAAEAWHFSPNGGGLVYIGSTNLDFPVSARKMQDITFSKWPGDGSTTPGDAFFATADSIASTVGDLRSPDRFVLFSVAFLGDPDMFVWYDVPRTLSVSYPTEVSLGTGAISVVVQYAGLPVAGARVGVYKSGDALASGLTGPDGIVDLDFLPAGPGEFSIMVTQSNAVPFEGTGTVVSGGTAHVALTSFAIDDTEDEAAGIWGNGDGVFDVGETVGIDLDFGNHGDGNVSQLSATLQLAGTTDDLGVEVEMLDSTVQLGALAQGASGTRERAFRLRAGSAASANQREATLPLEILWNQDGNPHVEEFTPNVYRYELVMYSSTIDELTGDGDGIPEAGEEYDVGLDFLNLGLGSPYGLEARIYSAPANRGYVEPASMPLIPAGPLGHVRTESDFYVKYFWGHNTFKFHLEIWDVSDPENERRVETRQFDMIRPEAPSGMAAQGFRDRIVLGWKPPSSADIQGFRVYRADAEEGPYAAIGVGLMPIASAEADSAYFADEGLPALTSFHYTVAAVDSSGNESIVSEPIIGTTAPGSLSGWPVTLNETNGNAPTVEQLDSGGYEVILASDIIYAFTQDGGDYYDGDETESTRGNLTEDNQGYKWNGKLAVYDIDGDGEKEIIGISQHRRRGDTSRALEMTCFDRRGNIKWSRPVGTQIALSPPAIGDIDGDGDLEVVALTGRVVWAFHHDGRPFSGSGAIRTLPDTEAFYLYGGVSLADVYNGPEVGALEIIFVTRPPTVNGGKLHILRANNGANDIPNFPLVFSDYSATYDWSNSSPAVADLNTSDSLLEVLVTTRQNIWAVDPAGSSERVLWSRSLTRYPEDAELNPSPAVGDLDRDGDPEVVVAGGSGHLYVLNARNGTPKTGFTTGANPYLVLPNGKLGSAVLGDITGDDFPEILIGGDNGTVYALDHTGQTIPGFPFVNGGEIVSGLALWDLNKDNTTELVISANQVLPITVLEFPGTYFNVVDPDLGRYPWTQFRHDTRNSGTVTTFPITPLALQAPFIDLVGLRTVRVRWIAEEGFAQFQLHRRDLRFEDWELVGSWRPNEITREDGTYAVEDLVPDFASYAYRLVGIEPDGNEVRTMEQSIEVTASSLEFALGTARPNPSGLLTSVELSLPQASPGRVVVVDPSGRVVRTLKEGIFEAGVEDVSWDGRDDAGRRIGAGVFFVRAEIDLLGSRSSKLIRLR